MPLIRCDYSQEFITEGDMRVLTKILFDASAELCSYNEEDAQNKISIFSTPYGATDHSTAAMEVEIRAKASTFDGQTGKSREEVRAEWLKRYEAGLIPFAKEKQLAAPIILTVTFQDWEVTVVTSEGSVPN